MASAIENEVEVRSAAGGILEQSPDRVSGREKWRVVTSRQPSDGEMNGLEFAWIVCAHVKSNAIVLTNESQSVGVGAGQMSRLDAAKVAIMKSIQPTAGTFAASDAFFPFRDGLDILADGFAKSSTRRAGCPGRDRRRQRTVGCGGDSPVARSESPQPVG